MCESPGFSPQLPMNRAQWHLVGGVQAILGCIVRPNPASKPKTPHSPGSWVMVHWALFMFFFYLGVWGWEGHAAAFMQKSGAGSGVPSFPLR